MGTRAVLCNCTVSYRVILQDVQLVNNFVVQVPPRGGAYHIRVSLGAMHESSS